MAQTLGWVRHASPVALNGLPFQAQRGMTDNTFGKTGNVPLLHGLSTPVGISPSPHHARIGRGGTPVAADEPGRGSPALMPDALVLLAVAAGFLLRVYRLGFQSLWYDESYGAYWAKKSLLEILTNTGEFHPPGYYALLWLQYRLAGDSELALRFVGVLFGVALVPIAYALGRRLGGKAAGVVAAWLAALAPLLVVYSQELRMYAPQTTVVALSTLLLWEAVHRGKAWQWIAYAFTASAALYLDYFPGMVLLAQAIALAPVVVLQAIRKGWWDQIGAFILANIVALVLFAPWLRVLLGQAQAYGTGGRELQVSPGGLLEDLWHSFLTGTNQSLPSDGLVLWLAAIGCGLAIVGLAYAVRERPGRVAFAVALAVVPVLIMIGVTQVRPFYHARFLLVALPPFLILFAVGASALRVATLPTFGAAALLLLPAFGVGLAGYYFDPRLAKLDAKSPGQFLAQQATADDLLFWGAQSPLAYYYRGPAQLDFFSVYPDSVGERLGQAVAGRRWVWWEASNLVDNDPAGIVPWLLTRAGRQVGDAWVGGYHLRWWEAASPEAYRMPALTPLGWRFDDAATVTGGAIGPAEGLATVPADGFVWAKVALDVAQTGPANLKYYVRLVGPDGAELGRTDGWVRNWDHRPTTAWLGPGRGEAYALFQPAPGTLPGRYSVWLGLYREGGAQITLTGGATAEGRLGEIDVSAPRVAVAAPPNVYRVEGIHANGVGRVLALDSLVPLLGTATAGEPRRATLYWRVTGQPSSAADAVTVRVGDFETAAPAGGGVDVSAWPEGALLRQTVVARGVAVGNQDVSLRVGPNAVPLGRLEIRPRSAPPPLPEGLRPSSGRLEQGAQLAGYRLTRQGENLLVEVYWRAAGPFAGPRQSFIQLLDGANTLIAQADGPFGGGQIAADALLPGDILIDRRTLHLPSSGGPYHVITGLYDAPTGQREPVTGGGDFVDLGRVE